METLRIPKGDEQEQTEEFEFYQDEEKYESKPDSEIHDLEKAERGIENLKYIERLKAQGIGKKVLQAIEIH